LGEDGINIIKENDYINTKYMGLNQMSKINVKSIIKLNSVVCNI